MTTPGSAEGVAPARTRPVIRRLSLSLVALAFVVFAASALAGSFQISGSISGTDPVSAIPNTSVFGDLCGQTVDTPGVQPGSYHHKVYTFRNISQGSQCVNVSLAVSAGSAKAAAYRGSFSSSNVTANFAGSHPGNPPIVEQGQANGFSFNISCYSCPGVDTFDVVVWEGVVDNGGTYTLLVEGTGVVLTGGGPTAAAALQSFRASSAPKGVLVRWRTRSETNALGFNVYRGDKKKVRLTRNLVRASGDGRGHSYSYIDRSARKGKRAPYYLEVVQRGGSKIMFGPALRTAR